jgi:rhamnogalacturonan endolyase
MCYGDFSTDLNTLQLTSMTADGGPNLDEFEFDVAGVTLWKSGTTALPGVSSFAGHIAYNPVQGILRVPVAGFAEVEILDLQGRCTRTFARFVQAGENLLSIDRNSLPQGMYWVRVPFWWTCCLLYKVGKCPLSRRQYCLTGTFTSDLSFL